MSQMPPPTVQTGGTMEPHRAVLVFVLGLLSILLCAILGPFAWTMGKKDLAKMSAGTMDPSGKGLTQAGWILGIIGTVFLVIWVLYVIFVVVLGVGVAAAGAAGAAGSP